MKNSRNQKNTIRFYREVVRKPFAIIARNSRRTAAISSKVSGLCSFDIESVIYSIRTPSGISLNELYRLVSTP